MSINVGENKLRATVLLAVLLGAVLSACGPNRWLPLETGTYTAISSARGVGSIEFVEVNRDHHLATLYLTDGTKTGVSFSSRDRAEWPTGCPANIGSTYMEVVDITSEPLTIGELTFEDPILVRDCPADPTRIALREDGLVGGGGSACAGLEKCLPFGRGPQADPVLTAPIVNAKPLPSSMKGYELYSWHDDVGDSWRYTLITGTNRLKTIEEITAEEDQVTQSEWVKITARGTDELKALLERLPPGTGIFWRGGDWLENEQQTSVNLMLPESSLVTEIQDHCRELELQLHLNQ